MSLPTGSDGFVIEAFRGRLGEKTQKRMTKIRENIRIETISIIAEVITFGAEIRRKVLGLEKTSMDECQNILEIVQKAFVFSQMTDEEVDELLQQGGWAEENLSKAANEIGEENPSTLSWDV